MVTVTMERESGGSRAGNEPKERGGPLPSLGQRQAREAPVVLPAGTNVRLGGEHDPPLQSTQQQAALYPSQPDGPGTAEDAPT